MNSRNKLRPAGKRALYTHTILALSVSVISPFQGHPYVDWLEEFSQQRRSGSVDHGYLGRNENGSGPDVRWYSKIVASVQTEAVEVR